MFRDFGRKLQRDIKRTVDARLKQHEDLSEGRIKPKPIDVQVRAFVTRLLILTPNATLTANIMLNPIHSPYLTSSPNSLLAHYQLITRLKTIDNKCYELWTLEFLYTIDSLAHCYCQVITHSMQRYAVWFGGSMLASTPEFYQVRFRSRCHAHGMVFNTFW